jgi:hypothetical protein
VRARAPLTRKIAATVSIGVGLILWIGPSLWQATALPAAPGMERLRPPHTVGGRSHVPASIATRPVWIGAAGDVACGSPPDPTDPDRCQYDETADLLAGLTGVLVLGDSQYDTGDYGAFLRYYRPTWGRFLSRTFPVPGNHEYTQDPRSAPTGYFRYFGDRVRGPDGLGYYSFDLPTGCTPGLGACWHLIALSSELCFAAGGCDVASDPSDQGPGNRMHTWLRNDLRAHPDSDYPCTLAFWHHPLFSISDGSASTPATRPLWEMLYEAHADIVLNGHSHNYQRWLPQDPSGVRDPSRGIREFIVGTGGASKYGLLPDTRSANLAASQNEAFGILRISLHRAGYTWRWVPAAGQPSGFTDATTSVAACV